MYWCPIDSLIGRQSLPFLQKQQSTISTTDKILGAKAHSNNIRNISPLPLDRNTIATI
jgi:hypothetical protein